MKILLSILSVIVICVMLVSCTGNEHEAKNDDGTESQSVSVTDDSNDNAADGNEADEDKSNDGESVNGGSSGATGDGYSKNY